LDRRRRHLIALAAALAALAGSAAAQELPVLREIGWLSEEGRLAALATEPRLDREALIAASSASPLATRYESLEQLRADLLVGEFLFKSPLLLGGQAAKAGVSCNSCHVNGRDNPFFQFPAISGEPGTADTTHSFFSETLGNDTFDPVPIPDLTQPGKVSHDLGARDLERFIAKIVIDEFGGSVSDEAVIRPLSSFVRALQVSGRVGDKALAVRSMQRDLADARAMVELAGTHTTDENPTVPRLLLAAARDRLFAVYERLFPGEHDAERMWLIKQSRALGDAQALLREGEIARSQLERWLMDFADAPDFAAIEPESLYNPDVLGPLLAK